MWRKRKLDNKIYVKGIDIEVIWAYYEAAQVLIRELIKNKEYNYLSIWDTERAKRKSLSFTVEVE
jgi:hypothetical protein